MTRRTVAVAVTVVLLVGCGSAKWQERGFDSEEDCYRAHGYTGGSISTDDFRRWDYWCG